MLWWIEGRRERERRNEGDGDTAPLLLMARYLELWRSTQIALFSKQSVYIRFDDYISSLITSTRGSVLRSTCLSIPSVSSVL